MKREKDSDVLYLVPLKDGGMMSMTMEQIEANSDKIMPADLRPAPEHRDLRRNKPFRGKKKQKPGEE